MTDKPEQIYSPKRIIVPMHSIRFASWQNDLAALSPDLHSRMVEFSKTPNYSIQRLRGDIYLLRLGQEDYQIMPAKDAFEALLTMPETPPYIPPQPREPSPDVAVFLAELGL